MSEEMHYRERPSRTPLRIEISVSAERAGGRNRRLLSRPYRRPIRPKVRSARSSDAIGCSTTGSQKDDRAWFVGWVERAPEIHGPALAKFGLSSCSPPRRECATSHLENFAAEWPK